MALDKHFTAYFCEWTYVYFGTENVQDERNHPKIGVFFRSV